METGGGGGCSSRSLLSTFSDVLSAYKGVVWLLLATIAEVPPVVSLATSLALLSHFTHYSIQVLMCLNLNGNYSPYSVMSINES
jgi:hypothetical protein